MNSKFIYYYQANQETTNKRSTDASIYRQRDAHSYIPPWVKKGHIYTTDSNKIKNMSHFWQVNELLDTHFICRDAPLRKVEKKLEWQKEMIKSSLPLNSLPSSYKSLIININNTVQQPPSNRTSWGNLLLSEVLAACKCFQNCRRGDILMDGC